METIGLFFQWLFGIVSGVIETALYVGIIILGILFLFKKCREIFMEASSLPTINVFSHARQDDFSLVVYHSDTCVDIRPMSPVPDESTRAPTAKPERSDATKVQTGTAPHIESEPASEKANSFAVIGFNSDVDSDCFDEVASRTPSQFARMVDEVVFNTTHAPQNLRGVVVLIHSPGGLVSEYGYLCAQMERLRTAGLEVLACIDQVAASGGYLMASVANHIFAAPSAYVGSIGVYAMVPNVRKFLDMLGITPRELTHGEYKRTLTMFDDHDENSDAHRHFKAKLEDVFNWFREKVLSYRRGKVNVELAFNGDSWSAEESVKQGIGLVDELATSDEVIMNLGNSHNLYFFSRKPSIKDKMAFIVRHRTGLNFKSSFTKRLLSKLASLVP